ncbi:MAG: tetratricopeptide repeat protein [Acidobacteriota bacterium]
MDQIKTEKESLIVLEDLFKSGKYEDTVKLCSELFKQFPSSFQIGLVKNKTLVKLTRYEEAEESVDELLRLYPENINLLLEKGNLLLRRDRNVEARIFFEKALFLNPFDEKAKEGIELTKKTEAEEKENSPTDFISYEKEKLNLEDTIRESDLEKLMEISKPDEAGISLKKAENSVESHVKEEPSLLEKVEVEPDPVSISFEDSSLLNKTDVLSNIEEEIEKKKNEKSNIELALEELNEISGSDLETMENVEEKSVEEENVVNEESKVDPSGENEDFITESAAILYLKQGLYDDARNIYSKLYENTNREVFEKKLETLQRVRLAHIKVQSLENFLSKLVFGRNKIV